MGLWYKSSVVGQGAEKGAEKRLTVQDMYDRKVLPPWPPVVNPQIQIMQLETPYADIPQDFEN